jgi:hypothetical protein
VRRFRFLRDPDPATLPHDVESFLRWLGGPACLLITGEDPTRCRALVTLLHGNEPSGAMALLRWLRGGDRPAVNLLCIVASVTAALTAPLFSHRMLPRARDLNRCFRPPFNDAQGKLAEEILALLELHRPEAVIDMHNTSGSGPSFAVCTFPDRQHDALAAHFTRRLIVSHLDLGALMEISESTRPTVTIEVGGRLDDEAHETAWEGLCRYAAARDVFAAGVADWGLERLRDPVRLELRDGVSLTYAEAPCPGHDITLRPDIEHHNFGAVTPDTTLGWAQGDASRLFRAVDASGACAVRRLVRVEAGRLRPAQPLKLFMIATNAGIAQSDCLFYAVADDGAPIAAA